MWTLSAFADEAAPDLTSQIAALQRANLKRLDLRSVNGYNIAELPREEARRVREQLEAAQISVSMLGTPIGKTDIADDFDAERRKLAHLGELAPVLGCRALRIFSFYNRENVGRERWRDEAMRRLTVLRDEAESYKLELFHENERHIFGDELANVREIATLRDDDFKLIFDFDNYTQGGQNALEAWKSLRDRTDAFHLKDSKNGAHVPVGLGDGHVREILQDALNRGWNGPLSIEPHLTHSGAIAQTGPSGTVSETYAQLPPHESFALACDAATQLLRDIGAQWE